MMKGKLFSPLGLGASTLAVKVFAHTKAQTTELTTSITRRAPHPFMLLLLLLVASPVAKPQSPEIKSIDSLLNLCMENNFINGDLYITVKNKPYYKKTMGYRDNAAQEPLKANAIFDVGSVSKPMTSIAILQLQERKLLSINDKVKKYLPLFPYENICIKHLLSHTSGIIGNLDLDENDRLKTLNNDSLIGLLVKYRPALQFEPGERWSYSNLGYDVLAHIVEQVSHQKFDVYMAEHVFKPAGMHRTFVPRSRNISLWIPKELTEKDLALPHSFENIASCTVAHIDSSRSSPQEYFYFYGSSHVYTTVDDLAKLDQALSKNKVLRPTSQALAYTPYRLNNGSLALDSLTPIRSYYGLGWHISVDTSWGKIIWHKGRTGGVRTVFLRNPDKKQMVAFSDNNDTPSTDLKAIACLKIMNHQPYRNPLYMSLVQKLGCDISTVGYAQAQQYFMQRKETQGQNYYISKDEMVDLAVLLEGGSHLADALSVLKLGNELFPDYWWLQISYGDLLLKDHQAEEAIVMYTHAVHAFDGSEADQISLLGSIGAQFIGMGRLADAETVLQLNTDLFPQDCNSYDNYAYILDQNNRLDLAISIQEKAVTLAKAQHHALLSTFQENLDHLKAKL